MEKSGRDRLRLSMAYKDVPVAIFTTGVSEGMLEHL